MANPSPSSSPATAAADVATSPTAPNQPPTTTSVPNAILSRPYQPSPAHLPLQPQSQGQPPLLPLPTPFQSHSILGRPPSTAPPSQHAMLYPGSRTANPVSGFAAPRGPPSRSDHMLAVAAGNLGYARASGPSVLNFPGAHQARAYGLAHAGDHGVQSNAVPVVPIRPQPHGPSPSLLSGARHAGTVTTGANGLHAPPMPRVAHAAPQPKVNSTPASVFSGDHNTYKDIREKARDDTVMVVHDRKVRILDTSSTSLYALCRSWVRNGSPQVCQPIGECLNALPRPFPTAAEVAECKQDECENDLDKEESAGAGSINDLTPQDLLKEHITNAKRIRARLKEKRLKRIDRYKQRLSCLLPLPTEPTRNDPVTGS